MEDFSIIVAVLVLLAVLIAFVGFVGMFILSFLDDLSIFIFKKPLFIHLYFRPKKIAPLLSAAFRKGKKIFPSQDCLLYQKIPVHSKRGLYRYCRNRNTHCRYLCDAYLWDEALSGGCF
jgi:hypothetical protein